MFRILDLKHGDYIRVRMNFKGRRVGDIVYFTTYESAEVRLNNMPVLERYQKRCKEQFVIEEVPNE